MGSDGHSVFVSHASSDKILYVDDLVAEIKALGIKVFYDTDVIEWGDNLREKIDKGLETCSLAVVVISPDYFDREWTEYEICALLKRQDAEKNKIILPILYNVSKQEFLSHYPQLQDIVFKYAKSQSKKELALLLKKELEKRKMQHLR